MKTELKIIEELYEDGRGDAFVEHLREHNPDLWVELATLRSTKEALDARPRRRPDQRTIHAILDASAGVSVASKGARNSIRRRDRAPHHRRSVRLRSAGIATTAVVVFIGIMAVWQSDMLNLEPPRNDASLVAAAENTQGSAENAPGNGENSTDGDLEKSGGDQMNAEETEEQVGPATGDETNPAPTLVQSTPRAADLAFLSSRQQFNAILAEQADSEVDVLAWDEGSEIVQVAQQIEMIQGGVALGWDPPSVPLETVPVSRQGGPRSPILQPAGQRRQP